VVSVAGKDLRPLGKVGRLTWAGALALGQARSSGGQAAAADRSRVAGRCGKSQARPPPSTVSAVAPINLRGITTAGTPRVAPAISPNASREAWMCRWRREEAHSRAARPLPGGAGCLFL